MRLSAGLSNLSQQGGLTLAEATAYARIGRDKLTALLQSGEVKSRRIGRRWVISRASLDDWLAGKKDE